MRAGIYCYNHPMRFNIFQQSDIPQKYRSNFSNLYLDIAWYGVLSGTAVNFLNVYATRLGASGLQIGLLTAMSAVVNLFLAIPAGHWISKRHTGRAVFWSSVLFRIGYLLFIPLPWLFNRSRSDLGAHPYHILHGNPAHSARRRLQRTLCRIRPRPIQGASGGHTQRHLRHCLHAHLVRRGIYPKEHSIPRRLPNHFCHRSIRRGDEQLSPLSRQTCAG
jgi:uncharacterized protein (DUF486 family)